VRALGFARVRALEALRSSVSGAGAGCKGRGRVSECQNMRSAYLAAHLEPRVPRHVLGGQLAAEGKACTSAPASSLELLRTNCGGLPAHRGSDGLLGGMHHAPIHRGNACLVCEVGWRGRAGAAPTAIGEAVVALLLQANSRVECGTRGCGHLAGVLKLSKLKSSC
jgi:hypothetical protein